MKKQDFFYTAIVISFIAHIATSFTLKIPYPKYDSSVKKDPKTEFVELEEEKKELKKKNNLPKIPPPYINIKNKMPTLKKVKPSKREAAENKKAKSVTEDIKEGFTQDEVKQKEVQSSPEYLNYYDMIREKIRKNAFKLYRSRENGRVVIDFVLKRNGSLLDVSVKIEGSSNSRYLKDIALKSVYKSLPFSSFPEGLKEHDSLPFVVSIFFRTK